MQKKKSLIIKEEKIIQKEVKILKKDIKKLESKALKIISGYDYPKLTILVLFFILAYFIFSNNSVQNYVHSLGNYGYLGIFIAGMFFTFGFTTPLSVGYFIIANPSNIYLAALLGGIGAVMGDLFIFNLIEWSFMDEFKRLKNEKIMKAANNFINHALGKKIQLYLMYALAGLIIASPLPDEAGVIMLAGLTKINVKMLAIISLIFNTLGIFVLLLI